MFELARHRRMIALCKLMVATLICLFISESVRADEAGDAQARWAATGYNNYSFTLTRRVMWGATSIVLIRVENGQLISADHIIKRTNPVPDHEATAESGLRKTINDLFNEMASRDDFIRASFNAESGYPVNIYYQNADWDEAEDQLEIRDFQLLTDPTPAG